MGGSCARRVILTSGKEKDLSNKKERRKRCGKLARHEPELCCSCSSEPREPVRKKVLGRKDQARERHCYHPSFLRGQGPVLGVGCLGGISFQSEKPHRKWVGTGLGSASIMR